MKSRSAIAFFITLALAGIALQAWVHPAAGHAAEYRIGAVTANVNLRKTPSLQGDVVAGLQKGLPVKVYGEKDGWYRVSAKKNYMLFNGWVYNRYVEIAATETVPVLPEVKQPEPLTAAPREAPLPATVPGTPPTGPTTRTQPADRAVTGKSEPGPAKTDAARTPGQKAVVEQSATSAVQKQGPAATPETPAASAADPQATDTLRLLLSVSPLVLAIIALLVAARALKAARTLSRNARPQAGPAAEEDLTVETPKIISPKPPVLERRHAPRSNRLIEVDFAVAGKFFRGFINNLSETGVYVDTPEKFSVGQEIIISCPVIDTGGYSKRVGLIVRLTETGIAVHFQHSDVT